MLHAVTFFALTVAFYWILDTNRRRTLHLTLIVCTGALAVGSEFLQGFLPNGRVFDLFDIAANVAGSLAGLALCAWYHKRMLERKRARRGYGAVAGGEGDDGFDGEGDLELGEGVGRVGDDGHEEGVGPAASSTLEEEVDNWDENAADDWDEDDGGDVGAVATTPGKGKSDEVAANGDGVKRSE